MNRTTASFAALALTAAAGLLVAGPLSPPAGPVASSYKTLTEVEPRTAINAVNTPGTATALFRITQPGSYYLTGNITGVSGRHGIEIAAAGVSIDLSGFTLTGVPGSLSGINGAGQLDVTVTNGSVNSWGQNGIDTGTGSGAHFSRLTVASNAYVGIEAGRASLIEDCVARANVSFGIATERSSIVTGCTAIENLYGFEVSHACQVIHCVAGNNTGYGILGADFVRLDGCVAFMNASDGFCVSGNCTITNCLAEYNTLNGFDIGGDCQITGNSAIANSAAGFWGRPNGPRSHLQGNHSNANVVGIKLDAASNLVHGNTCGGNTTANYQIIAGNRVGAIYNMPLSPAINGSVGGTSGTVDPASNFAY